MNTSLLTTIASKREPCFIISCILIINWFFLLYKNFLCSFFECCSVGILILSHSMVCSLGPEKFPAHSRSPVVFAEWMGSWIIYSSIGKRWWWLDYCKRNGGSNSFEGWFFCFFFLHTESIAPAKGLNGSRWGQIIKMVDFQGSGLRNFCMFMFSFQPNT